VSRIVSIFALILTSIVGFSSPVMAQSSSAAQAQRADDHVIGSPTAPVRIIEYASYSCPHCAHFQQDVWPIIYSEFVQTGQVNYIVRPMLTQPVQLAGVGVILTECVAEERFFEAVDMLFVEQARIMQTAQEQGDLLSVYNEMASRLGLTEDSFMTCLSDPEMNALVNEKANQAIADGIQGTPSFIINGRILATGTGNVFNWGGEPLLINGEQVPARLDGDTFRRIILHFSNSPQ